MQIRQGVAATASLVAAVLVSSVALAACSGGGGEITVWTYPVVEDEARHQKFWDKVVADFEKENPEITVDVSIHPWKNRDEALATARAGGKGPDVIYLIPDQLPKFTEDLVDAESYLPATTLADYRENAVESVSPAGTMLGAPLLMTIQTPVCNKKLFDQAGVSEYPTSWEDFADLGPVFAREDVFLTDFAATPTSTLNLSYYPWLWQAGGAVFSRDGKSVTFGTAEGQEALGFVAGLAEDGFVDPESLTRELPPEQTAAYNNKVACTMSAEPGQFEKPWGTENVKILPPLKNEVDVTYGTVGSLGIFSDSDKIEQSGKFISYVTQPDLMREYVRIPGYFSPRQSQASLYTDDPVLGEQEKYLDLANVGPLEPQAREVNASLAPEIQSAMLGKKTPEQALADGEKEAESLIR